MASVLTHRPAVNGANSSKGTASNRAPSLSSFPPSRSSSNASRNAKPPSSPLPPLGAFRNSYSVSKELLSQMASSQSLPDMQDERPSKRLRSQYPRESAENHVEYILVASFDIDRGPIMEHQYPGPISGDENMLAELMLPDQTHMRKQDWTIFFLHKDTSQDDGEDDPDQPRRKRRRKRPAATDEEKENSEDEDVSESDESGDSGAESEPEGGEGPPLIYVLNLVNTVQDKTAKRGAVVKAMAICTRHSFLHIYKPLLLLALEEYFRAPVPETLASLYDAVNSMDLSLMPRLSVLERHILQGTDIKDMFVEKFEQMIRQRMEEDEQQGTAEGETIMPDSPSKVVPTQHRLPRDTHEFESQVVYNGIPIPIKVPTAVSPETVGDFSLIKLIQTFSGPHSKEPQPFALHAHLTTGGAYTHPIIVLANALLTQKRVIFLGHNRPSGEVAEAVLAACALTSGGVLRGFTRHAFPYTDLTKIDDLLKVPGFIAGVTNPAFASHPEWWDLLCDIPTGRIKISNKIEPPMQTEGLIYFQQQNPAGLNSSGTSFPAAGQDATGDVAFMEDVLKGIAARHGEGAIRAKWRDWVVKFTRIAAAFEESVYGASALYIGGEEADAAGTAATGIQGHGYVWPDDSSRWRELAGGVSRIEGWRNTRSYYSFIQDLAQLYLSRPIKTLDLHHLHDRLRTQKLPPNTSALIYLTLSSSISTYPEICQLLCVTPESHAGLFYISLGLFHTSKRVREKTAELLERVQMHEAGRHFWASLGRFLKMAYWRTKKAIEAGEAVGSSTAAVSLGIDGVLRGQSAHSGGSKGSGSGSSGVGRAA